MTRPNGVRRINVRLEESTLAELLMGRAMSRSEALRIGLRLAVRSIEGGAELGGGLHPSYGPRWGLDAFLPRGVLVPLEVPADLLARAQRLVARGKAPSVAQLVRRGAELLLAGAR